MSITIQRAVAFSTKSVSLYNLYLECQKGKDSLKPKFSTRSGVLQRISQTNAWRANNYYRAKQYLHTVLTGAAKLDQFIVVPAELVLQSLKYKAKFDAGKTDPKVWKQVISDIQEDVDGGVLFYIIDGQNRIYNAIVPFFENKLSLGSAPIIGTNAAGEEVFFQGKRYKDFDEEMKEYVKGIELTLVVATKGDVDDFTNALIAKNEGLPWEEWMKNLTKKWMMPYRAQLQKVTGNPQVRATLNRISGESYAYEKNGHELLVSELLIWMEDGFQPSKGVDEHQAYFDGRKTISNKDIESLIKYIKEFGDGYADIKSKSGFSNVEFRNYIMMRWALDNPKTFHNKMGIPNWKIELPIEFVNLYRIYNKVLATHESGFEKHTIGNKTTKVKKPGHYPWACSKYDTELLNLRLKLLFAFFKKNEQDLFDMNVVSVRPSDEPIRASLEEVFYNNPNTVGDFLDKIRAVDVVPEKYDRGHIKSRKNGGSNDIDNLVVQEKSHNRSTGAKNLA